MLSKNFAELGREVQSSSWFEWKLGMWFHNVNRGRSLPWLTAETWFETASHVSYDDCCILDLQLSLGALLEVLWESRPDANLTPLVSGIRDVKGWVIYLYGEDGTTYPATAPQPTAVEAVVKSLIWVRRGLK